MKNQPAAVVATTHGWRSSFIIKTLILYALTLSTATVAIGADNSSATYETAKRLRGDFSRLVRPVPSTTPVISDAARLEASPDESAGPISVINATAAVLTVGPSCTYTSIQAAVDAASSGDTIRVTSSSSFSANNATFNVTNKSLTIIGGYNFNCSSRTLTRTVLDGQGMSFPDSMIELLDTVGGMGVTLSNFDIKNGQDDGNGGGGIEISGLAANRTLVLLLNVLIRNNLSTTGAGMHMTDADVQLLSASKVYSNVASGNGGGVYCNSGSLIIAGNATIGWAYGNRADNDGGGVYLDNCDLTLNATDGSSSAIIGLNTAVADGGGVFARNDSRIDLHGDLAWINGNNATRGGGVYLALNSQFYGDNGNLTNNSATQLGGGFYLIDGGSLFEMGRVNNYPCGGKCNELSGNDADFGGAGYVQMQATANIRNAWIEGNVAVSQGSAFYSRGSLFISDSMILDQFSDANTVPLFGILDGTTTVQFSTIVNTLNAAGGTGVSLFELVSNPSGTLFFDSNIVWQNQFSSLFSTDVGQSTFVNGNVMDFNEAGWNLNAPPLFLGGSSYHISPLSPAVDFGNAALVSDIDIDKEARPLGAAPDAGADEVYARIGVAGGTCAYSTVTEAIAAASAGDTIYISPGNYVENPGVIDKTLFFRPSNETCTAPMQNPDSQSVVIDGSGLFRTRGGLFEITNSSFVQFSFMTLRNAQADFGGVIFVEDGSTLSLNDSDVAGGVAQEFGGGIRAEGGVEMLSGSAVYGNSAQSIVNGSGAQNGGGIAITDTGTLSMSDDSFVGGIGMGNTAVNNGGGIYSSGGNIWLGDTAAVLGNSADFGGGIFVDAGSSTFLTLNDQSSVGHTTRAGGNSAAQYGGGIRLAANTELRLNASATIQNNTAGWGGGVSLNGQTNSMIANGGLVLDNASTSLGAGIEALDGPFIQLTGIQIIGNISDSSAGGIFYSVGLAGAAANLTILDSNINNNSADWNGGAIEIRGLTKLATFTVTNTTIRENNAGRNGGGIAMDSGSTLVANGTTIFLNVANNDGGGIYLKGNGSIKMDGSYLGYNLATTGNGGGIYAATLVKSVELTSLGSKEMMIRNNRAPAGSGGGVYHLGDAMILGSDVPGSEITYLLENESQASESESGGGALYLDLISFQADGDIRFLDNIAAKGGGAIYSHGGTGVISGLGSTRPLFAGNQAAYGGAVYMFTGYFQFIGTDFGLPTQPNTGLSSGGGAIRTLVASIDLINVNMSYNDANTVGGALDLVESTVLIDHYAINSPGDYAIDRCNPSTLPADTYCSQFEANGSNSDSIIEISGSSSVEIKHTSMRNNNSTAVVIRQIAADNTEIDIQHVLFENNAGFSTLLSKSTGGNSTVSVTDTTFAGNTSTYTIYQEPSGVMAGSIDNSIIWANNGGVVLHAGVSSSCNLSQDSALSGINADPLFATTNRGKYRLSGNSPAIDACFSTSGYDLDNQFQPRDGDGLGSTGTEYDIGAFEYQLVGQPLRILTVALGGLGNGSVTSSPAGISCGGICQASFASGTSVTLTASPASGDNFAGWTGSCQGSANPCVLPLNTNEQVEALFNKPDALFSDSFE